MTRPAGMTAIDLPDTMLQGTPAPMRITFALPGLDSLSGGMRVISQYAHHLRDQGHHLTLAVRRPGCAPGRKLRLLGRFGLAGKAPPLSPRRGHFTGLDVPVLLLDEYAPVRPSDLPDADVIISTWWTTAVWAHRLPPSKGRHIHFIQDYEDFYPERSARVQAVYGQDNPKIVVSGWLRDMLAERNGQNCLLVNNGVDTTRFATPRRDLNTPPRIGFLYSGHPRKNCLLAIEVLNRLREARPGLNAIAFGSKPRPDDRLPGWVGYEQRPAQGRIPEIYASCDLWLFPSRSEGFGLPLLEAMASRTPVVATDAGAALDLIDGRNGRIVPPDPESFVTAIRGILDAGPDAWRAMSDAAWQTAQEHDLKIAARSFEAVVAGLVAR